MQIPFTTNEFLNVFREYNAAFPFVPILTYAAGAVVLGLAGLRGRLGRKSDRAILSVLALFWLWNGVAYQIGFFRAINPGAILFGGLFILQGLLFVASATRNSEFGFAFSGTPRGGLGSIFILYAMVLYPLLGYALGHTYPASPVFGMAPCPTTIFTFGVLLLARRTVPVYLIVIPLLWSLIGFGAAMKLGIYEDFGLTVAGLAGATSILLSRCRAKTKYA